MTLPTDYSERVYAGWVGKCIGVRYGAPTESLTYHDIQSLFGELDAYLQTDPRIFHPDDDLNGPILFLRTLDDYGDDPPAARFGDTWLNHIADGRGTLWWGGYGISSEHTAYMNLKAGIAAPESGSMAMNGPVVAEQIGGQIFSDGWGLICPNNPMRAAELAARAARVSHDGNAVYGGMFIAAMNALAFSAKSVREVVEGALQVIPSDSVYAQVVRAIIAFYEAHPGDWRACYQWIHQHHGYDKYPGKVHVVPNAAIVVMALMYGEGDFLRSLHIANMGGWDTDCNVGNAGSVLGVLVGIAGIPLEWRTPMNDMLVLASLIGSRNITDMGRVADDLVRHGHRQAGLPEPPRKPRYHFSYPGGVQGFLPLNDGAQFVSIEQTCETGQGCLKIVGRDMFRRRGMGAYVRTYLRPEELDSNNYRASFSPTIYPGQTMTARVMPRAESNPELIARLFVRDGNSGERIEQSPGLPLKPGEWQQVEWRIPPMTGACLDQAGLFITAMHAPHLDEVAYLDDLDWGGAPEFAYDFGKERSETDACSQWTFLRGYWALEDGAYAGGGVGQNETYSGDVDWTDYALTVRLSPVIGDRHMILARVQGALRSYALGLLPGRLALLKNDSGYTEVASTPLEWAGGETCELGLVVSGARLEGWCAGASVSWEDSQPHRRGAIGLANGPRCRTRFLSVAVAGF